jgi:MFS family permease
MTLSVLKQRNFRNYFLADAVSQFGTGMSFIGVNWFMLKLTGTSASVGLLIACALVGGLVMFPFAGTISDRFDRRGVLIWSNVARALFILLIAGVYFFGPFHPAYLYMLEFVAGAGWTIYYAASRALVQEILPTGDYAKGNSFIEVSLQVGMFTASGAAGIIYKYFGFGSIMIIDAATFFISNLFLAGIHCAHVEAHDRAESFARRLRNGLAYLKDNPVIFAFGVVAFISFVATMSSNAVLPAYVYKHLRSDAVVFGISDMLYGVGACVAGLVTASIAARLTKSRTVVLGFAFSTTALFYLVFNGSVAGLYAGYLVFGLCNAGIRILTNTILMEEVPKAYMGRAMSVWMGISYVLEAVSTYGVGVFVDRVTPAAGYAWISGIMLIGFISYALLARKLPKPVELLPKDDVHPEDAVHEPGLN